MSVIPTIRPISEFKNTTEISNLCHEVKASILITKNGYSDLVIMNIDTYERNMAILELCRKLDKIIMSLSFCNQSLTPRHVSY